jgi:hypothetical protein
MKNPDDSSDESFDRDINFPTPKKDAPPKFDPKSPESKYKAKKKQSVANLM